MNKVAHRISTPKHHNKAKAESFTEKHRCITAIKLLCQLSRAVQLHRAASMSFLGGEPFLGTRLEQLQEDIHTILLLLRETTCRGILSKEELSTLDDNWNTILVGWQQDHFMQNFEFHSHVIEELKKLLRHCRQQLIPATEQHLPPNQLLHFLLEPLFDNTESIAKLRSLFSSTTLIKASGKDVLARISYLLREISEQNELLYRDLTVLEPRFPQLALPQQFKHQEKTLHRLLFSVRIQILETPEIHLRGDALFELANEFIDNRWKGLEQGLNIIQQSAFDGLINNTL